MDWNDEIERLEDGIGRALNARTPTSSSAAADRVLGRIAGRTPAQFDRDEQTRTLRSWCAVAAVCLAITSAAATFLPRSTEPIPADGAQMAGSTSDEMSTLLVTAEDFGGYSDRSSILVAVFDEEMMR